ncbi:MAG TPA: prepilin-type N-terminal cleavage/methylation domain-containing protein [Thermoanaerobaculia bacterium]|nr:prepilin-type N-terminal cleavage/methylation domain-containing protein [Thermoanaerobaculia bacterium]
MQQQTKARRHDSGYNLVETILAMAILGVILMSVVTLFFIGRRNVYSGKQMSAANAVATRVLEDLSLMTATDVLDNFRLATATPATNVVASVSYPNSILRDTDEAISTDTNDASGYLARWKALVDTANELPSGRVILIVTPQQPTSNATTVLQITTAQVVRIRGVVEWSEGLRRRNVTFDSSKLQRP